MIPQIRQIVITSRKNRRSQRTCRAVNQEMDSLSSPVEQIARFAVCFEVPCYCCTGGNYQVSLVWEPRNLAESLIFRTSNMLCFAFALLLLCFAFSSALLCFALLCFALQCFHLILLCFALVGFWVDFSSAFDLLCFCFCFACALLSFDFILVLLLLCFCLVFAFCFFLAKGVWGPHLIVVPTSCIVNWETELKRFLPGFKVKDG